MVSPSCGNNITRILSLSLHRSPYRPDENCLLNLGFMISVLLQSKSGYTLKWGEGELDARQSHRSGSYFRVFTGF